MSINLGSPTISFSSAVGIVTQSFDCSPEATRYTALDENGNTIQNDFRDQKITGSFEVLCPSGTVVPFPGETCTVSGVTMPTVTSGVVSGGLTIGGSAVVSCYITDASIRFSNTDYTSLSVSVERDIINGLPA